MTNAILAGRTAVVTGSASGIGLAIATRFAQNGANVVLSDIREDTAALAAARLSADGLTVTSFAANAASEGDLRNLLDYARSTYGTLDILVNNAGAQHVANIEEFPVEKFQALIDLMLTGPFMATKHAFSAMKQQAYGRVLNIASINGLVGFAGKAAYNAAKHGVIGLTKVAALEGAQFGITVNALCPGYVDTPLVRNQMADLASNRGIPIEAVLAEVLYPLIPQRRLLDPFEVADYALFLVSERGRSVTGQAVVIDGGYLAQ